MTAWTRERRAIVAHVARCSFCADLLAHSRCRSDRLLLAAADQLAWQHAENDAEHAALARRPAKAGGRE